jgi:hypothetical protein
MKIKNLTPILCLAAFSSFLFPSCKKDEPGHPPTTDSTVNLKKGLLVYLPFSGNFADSSGNNNPTQLVGADGGLTSDRQGNANSAFGGSGAGGRIEVTNNGSIKFDSAFTISVNFMELNSSMGQVLASMVKVEDGKGPSFLAGNSIVGMSNVQFSVVRSSSTCDEYGNDKSTVDTSGFIPQAGTWYNLICTFNKGNLRMYLNGKLISEQTTTDPLAHVCPNAKFVAGGWWQNDPESINGKLDEVRLYDRALNAAEIAKLAQGFSQEPPTSGTDLRRGLLVYLPFNGSIADSSGNNNPTQIVGSGAGLTYDIHGYANSAYGCDGTSGRLEVTNNGSIAFDTAFSVSLSFMERATGGNQVLASLVRTDDAKGPSFLIGNSMVASSNVWFGVPRGITCDQYGISDVTDTTNFTPQVESWYNLICTFRKGTLRTYINGKLVKEKTAPAYNSQVCPTAKFVVGGWWQNDPESVNGKIDNVRLYNRELNSEEIALLAQYYQPTTNRVHQVVTH